MGRTAAILALLCAPATAQEVTFSLSDDAVVVVTLDNRPTLSTEDEEAHTFETPLGPVTVLHTRTANGPNGCCPDRIEVVDWPAGTFASPSAIDVEEKQIGSIVIREYVGG